MYFKSKLEVPINSSHDSEDVEYENDPPKDDKYIFLGHKNYYHLTINLCQNNQKDTKRVVVKIQPHQNMRYLKKKIGQAFEEYDEFKGLRGLKAKRLTSMTQTGKLAK